MIELSGTLGGRVYNQEVVSPDEFAKLVKAPGKKTGDDQHILELCPHLVKKDAWGQESHPRSVTINTTTTLYVDGDIVNVRYFRTKTPIANGMGQFKYSPDHLEFKGKTNSFSQREYEQFLFLYSSPLCANSPSASQEPMLQYHDPAALEVAANNKATRLTNLIEAIQNAPDTDVIARSRGIVVRGEGTNVPQNQGASMHRAALIQLLVRYQDDFEAEWLNDSVPIRGLAREAMYRGVIKQKQVGTRKAWVWAENDNVILFVASETDPFAELVNWCISSDNTDYAKESLTRAISGQAQRVPELHPSTPPPQADPSAQKSELRVMLEKGVAKGVVWREEETNRIMYQGQQGPVETVTFDGGDWIAKLETFCKTPGKQHHRSAIEVAVNN